MARPGTFTVESSKIAVAASIAARRAKAERKFEPAILPLAAPLPMVDDYTKLRLTCVRQQLGQVDKAILLESSKDHPDGQRLNWLASAQERLAEQERQLAGRPLPGSFRPREDRSARSQSPIYDNSPPVPVVHMQPAPVSAPVPVSGPVLSSRSPTKADEQPVVQPPAPPPPPSPLSSRSPTKADQ